MFIGGRPLCNLRFADEIDLLGGNGEELELFTERLEKTVAGYGMEINFDQRKILVKSIKQRTSANIWMNGKVLEEVDQFIHLESTQTTLPWLPNSTVTADLGFRIGDLNLTLKLRPNGDRD